VLVVREQPQVKEAPVMLQYSPQFQRPVAVSETVWLSQLLVTAAQAVVLRVHLQVLLALVYLVKVPTVALVDLPEISQAVAVAVNLKQAILMVKAKVVTGPRRRSVVRR